MDSLDTNPNEISQQIIDLMMSTGISKEIETEGIRNTLLITHPQSIEGDMEREEEYNNNPDYDYNYEDYDSLESELVSEDEIDELITNLSLQEAIDSIMPILKPKEQQIIKERYYDQKTLDEIGKEHNLSREHIRQIEMKALRKLRCDEKARKSRNLL